MATNDPTIGQTTFIYGLKDPRTGELRYVGKSDNPQARLHDYLREHKKTPPVYKWAHALAQDGLKPTLIILDEVSVDSWQEAEEQWIAKFRALGAPLLNILLFMGRQPRRPGLSEAERFWPKVDKKTAPLVLVRGHYSRCWLWRGTLVSGYGKFHVGKRKEQNVRSVSAARWAYEQQEGPIAAGLQLDHLCRNPPCVRPSHLEPVTPAENVYRSNNACSKNARKTHCLRGHPFTEENTRHGPKGGRRCLICCRQEARERQQKLRKDPVIRESLYKATRSWYQRNRDQQLIYKRQQYQEHRDEYIARQHRYYQDHRNQQLASQRQYYQEHREQRLAYQRQHDQEQREQRLAYMRKYRQKRRLQMKERT